MLSEIEPANDALATASTPGAMLALSCSGCHSLSSSTPSSIPSLRDLSATQIKTALLGFRKDSETATVMSRIAKGYTEAQIAVLATHLAQQ